MESTTAQGPAEIKAGIHWWTACTGWSVDHVERTIGRLSKPERPGGFGHPHKRLHESGTAIYCGSDNPHQPVVINGTGEVCDDWSKELVNWTSQLGGWCTRVDFALDLEPATQARRRLNQMRRAFLGERCDTTMHQGKDGSWDLRQNKDGWTLYCGSKDSALRLRAYDERGPLRLEFQVRPERQMGELMPELVEEKGVMPLWRMCARQIVFPMKWYQALVKGEVVELLHEERVDSALMEAMEQMNKQFGRTLWAFKQLGLTMADLMTEPEELKGSTVAKFLAWAKSAEVLGLDGKALEKAVKRCVKSDAKQ